MRLIDAERFDVVCDKVPDGMDAYSYNAGVLSALRKIDDAPTVDAIQLDTKIVVQTYDEEHEEWANEIMTIQELLDSGMCEIYREECADQYE